MKIVINDCFGGFSLSEDCAKALGVSRYPDMSFRTNQFLVEMVERDPEFSSGDNAELSVLEIPEDATDWYISDYDGQETLLVVVDGKIRTVF